MWSLEWSAEAVSLFELFVAESCEIRERNWLLAHGPLEPIAKLGNRCQC
jgi:hypothetical protein